MTSGFLVLLFLFALFFTTFFFTFLAFSVISAVHPATAGFDLLEAVAQEPS